MNYQATTRLKIFQRPTYMQIEEDFNAWSADRDLELSTIRSHIAEEAEASDNSEIKEGDESYGVPGVPGVLRSFIPDLASIPPQTHLSFDSSLQKYILTVVYHTYTNLDDRCPAQ